MARIPDIHAPRQTIEAQQTTRNLLDQCWTDSNFFDYFIVFA